jgi:hypothetical protein
LNSASSLAKVAWSASLPSATRKNKGIPPSGEPPRGIHTLPEYATGATGVGIAAPYELTMAAYRNTLRQLYGYVEHVGVSLQG